MSIHSFYNLIEKENKKDKEAVDNSFLTAETLKSVPRIRTNNAGLDYVFGGGVPLGRIIQLFGPESGGKSALCFSIVKCFMDADMPVLYVDAEQTFDPTYVSRTFGIDLPKSKEDIKNSKIAIVQENRADFVYNYIESAVKEHDIKLVVIDSLDSLSTPAEQDGTATQAHIGQMARVNTTGLKRLIGVLNKQGATLIIVSQIRANIGGYGASETTSGGSALKHYCSIRMRVGRKEWIQDSDNNMTGLVSRIKTVKNKVARPHIESEVVLHFDKGYDTVTPLITLGSFYGFIKQAGAYYSVTIDETEHKFQGKQKLADFLSTEENKVELEKLREMVYDKF